MKQLARTDTGGTDGYRWHGRIPVARASSPCVPPRQQHL